MKMTISIALFIYLSLSAFAQETGWKVGFAKVKITPNEPVFMAGYSGRNKPFEKVDADLYAKAVALTDSKNKRAVLITTDLVGFSAAVIDPVFEKIIAKTGLERSEILINSSHIHTGPSLTLDPAKTEKRSAEQSARQVAYTKDLQQKIVQLAIDALAAKPQEVELSCGMGVVNFVMNRREFTEERGVILGVNPSGPVDRSVPVLKISTPGANGKLLGVVFQAACHNTTLGGTFYNITGDFAGYAQTHMEKEFPGAQAMFMTGCGGDANPYLRDNQLTTSQKHGTELGAEVTRVLREGKLKPVHGPLNTAFSRAKLPLQPLMSKEEITEIRKQRGGWRKFVAEEMSKYHEPGAKPFPKFYQAPLAVWQFGKDLTLVALSGEVVVDYVQIIEHEIGPLNLWISAYCNEVSGYLPSARVLREGGYETRGLYHGVGLFKPETETVVAKEIRKLAIAAGREVPD